LALLLSLTAPALADDAAVRTFLKTHLLAADATADFSNSTVSVGYADLDGDGVDEAIAYLSGPYWCGSGGCGAYVLKAAGDTYQVVTETSVTQLPIGVLPTSSNGWRDLYVSVSGGGMAAGTVALKFDGKTYPDNPTVDTVAADPATGTELIAEDAAGVGME
jgi:hypothetical protein